MTRRQRAQRHLAGYASQGRHGTASIKAHGGACQGAPWQLPRAEHGYVSAVLTPRVRAVHHHHHHQHLQQQQPCHTCMGVSQAAGGKAGGKAWGGGKGVVSGPSSIYKA